MAVYKKVPGCETVNISTLEFDTKPTKGSFNPVTSGGVAESVAQQSSNIAPNYTKKTYEANSYVMQDGVLYTNPNAIGTAEDWNPAHWTQTTVAAIVPEGTSKVNPLMTAEETERMIDAMKPIDAMTLRFEFSKKDYDPDVAGVGSAGTWTKVDSPTLNIWDWTNTNTDWSNSFKDAFPDADNEVRVIAAGDTSAVTSMSFLFRGCTSLMSVPLFDMSAVTDMGSMFRGCTSLTSVPLFNISKVSNMNDTFNGCISLTSVPLFDTSAVTSMNGSFNNCTSLASVPLFNTSAVTNMSFMLRGCSSLTSVPLFDTSKVTNLGSMLNGCTKVEGGALALYQQASTQATPPANHTDAFKSCGMDTTTGAAELAQIPQSWGGLAEG